MQTLVNLGPKDSDSGGLRAQQGNQQHSLMRAAI